MKRKMCDIFQEDVVVLLGNGLNNFINVNGRVDGNIPSWKELIIELAKSIGTSESRKIVDLLEESKRLSGISYPEIFTALTLQAKNNLHQLVAEKLSKLESSELHKQFCATMRKMNHPIITTNYDYLLENSFSKEERLWISNEGKQRYPIDRCFKCKKSVAVEDNSDFSIWHINGIVSRPESMRLGYVDYCNYIAHLTRYYPQFKNVSASIFEEAPQLKKTLFYPLFTKKLIIMGLGLCSDEIVLRWILNRRYRYWQLNHPEERKSGWFLCCEGEYGKKVIPDGMKIFLESVGVDVVSFKKWPDIYAPLLNFKL